jgi:peptidoglycan hydrolase-like protein with peptidoglycan-binding domain
LHRPIDVAVLLARRSSRLRIALVAGAVLALVGAAPGAGTALADDPASGGGASLASVEETLRKGDRGSAVRKLQRRLGIAADGVFGPQTARAVRRYQRRHGLVADGIVGPLTRGELGLARFSSADIRHPGAKGGSKGGDSPVKLPRVLAEIAECESGGDPRAVSANGMYRGKYQFSRSTWRAMGGRGKDPARASEAHQDRMALKLYRAQGVAPWPACGARATDG